MYKEELELKFERTIFCLRQRQKIDTTSAGIILWVHTANDRRCYIIMSSLIGYAHSQTDPCQWSWNCLKMVLAKTVAKHVLRQR